MLLFDVRLVVDAFRVDRPEIVVGAGESVEASDLLVVIDEVGSPAS